MDPSNGIRIRLRWQSLWAPANRWVLPLRTFQENLLLPTSDFQTIVQGARRLFATKKAEPSYPSLPEVDSTTGETNVPGIYAAGELAGTPLVKLGLNAGHDLVERLVPVRGVRPGP